MPAGVQAGKGGADRDGLAGADFAGDHADGTFVDAPLDPGDGFVVGGVAVQHAWGQVTAERGAVEAVVGLQFLNHVNPRKCCLERGFVAQVETDGVGRGLFVGQRVGQGGVVDPLR